jgi:hypothetical protein
MLVDHRVPQGSRLLVSRLAREAEGPAQLAAQVVPLACAALACLVLPSLANAGPYETGDASHIEARVWSIYLASDASFGPGRFTGSAPQLGVNHGVVEDVQLHVAVPLMLALRAGEDMHYGLGDVDFGVKARLVAQSRAGVAVGTYPRITLPTGSEEQGLGNSRITFELPIWLQKSIGAWTIYGGGGYRAYAGSDASDRVILGLLVECGPGRCDSEPRSTGTRGSPRPSGAEQGSTWGPSSTSPMCITSS